MPEASKELQTNFSRNPKDFALNQYATFAPVKKEEGYYIVHNPDEEVRITSASLKESEWQDGTYLQDTFTKNHSYVAYKTHRVAEAFTIGDLMENQADWSIVADHGSSAAARLMGKKTQFVITELSTSGNWDSGHIDTCTNLAGGKFAAATNSAPYIRKGIQAGIQLIEKATNATVSTNDLVFVVPPDVAFAMSQSQEWIDTVKQSPFAMQVIEGTNFSYGIPNSVHGVRIVVENAIKNTAKKGTARSGAYIAADTAFLLTRPGALMGNLNTMSALTLAVFQDMSAYTEHDNFNELTRGKVVENYDIIVRGNQGVVFTDCV